MRTALLVVVLIAGASACAQQDSAAPSGAAIFDAELSEDGRTLTVDVSACAEEATASVVESADEVRVDARVARRIEGDCAVGARVRLTRPLGDRKVVDERSGLPVEVRERP